MNTLRNVLLTFVLIALAGCAGQARKETVAALKIATWNIEHLAEADGSGCHARSEADYAALRNYVATLDADVIAFEEVESAAAAQRVFSNDQYTIVFSQRPASKREGFCRRDATSGPTIRNQHVGFAVRNGVEFTRHPDVSALGLGDPDLRWGVDITVHGAKPIRLLALHLKSGCARGDTNEACPILFDQVPVLNNWISARQSEGVDYVLLGDWNRRMSLPDDSIWQRINANLPAAKHLVDAANGRGATCIERFPDYIDHIVLSAGAAARMAKDSFAELSYGVPESEYPSDHCPISVSIQ